MLRLRMPQDYSTTVIGFCTAHLSLPSDQRCVAPCLVSRTSTTTTGPSGRKRGLSVLDSANSISPESMSTSVPVATEKESGEYGVSERMANWKLTFFLSSTLMALASFRRAAEPRSSSCEGCRCACVMVCVCVCLCVCERERERESVPC